MSTALIVTVVPADLANLAVLSLPSPASRRNYARYCRAYIATGLPLDRTGVQAHVIALRDAGARPGTINNALAAVRLLAREAWNRQLLSDAELSAIERIKSARQLGSTCGNWLNAEGVGRMLDCAAKGPHGTRNAALIAVMIGCGLRRAELAAMTWENWQQREGRWVFLNLIGKGGRIRTVPAPDWVAERVNAWREHVR
jgi:integrase